MTYVGDMRAAENARAVRSSPELDKVLPFRPTLLKIRQRQDEPLGHRSAVQNLV